MPHRVNVVMAAAIVEGGCEGPNCNLCRRIGVGDRRNNQPCQIKNVVYLITSAGQQYVGQTIQTLATRMSKHKHSITVGRGDGMKFIRHFQTHNFDSADITILKTPPEEKLDYWERYYIAEYDTFKNGLNSTRGPQAHK